MNQEQEYQKSQFSRDDNPKVYMDISRDGDLLGRMEFELFAQICPKTCENFRQIITGQNEFGYTYKKNVFHRIIGDFMAQGGDITQQNGQGGASIYGATFEDENNGLMIPHAHRGLLSMANKGRNTNSSQFFISMKNLHWLNGKHVIFGQLTQGMRILRALEVGGSKSGKPTGQFVIEDCGQL